jgi:hypothetical protein
MYWQELVKWIRATLDESLRSRVQWSRAILLAESHKLDPPPPWDEDDPRPTSGKSSLNIHGTILVGKSIGLDPKKKKKKSSKENSWFGESFLWLPIFLTNVCLVVPKHILVLPRKTHIGSMLCTFWDCNGTKTVTNAFQEQNVHNKGGANCVETMGKKEAGNTFCAVCNEADLTSFEVCGLP